MSANEQYMCF